MTERQDWWPWAIGMGVLAALYLLAPILTPFAVSAGLAYLADPLTDRLERLGIARSVAVVMVFIAMLAAVGLFLLLLVPMLETQIGRLIDSLPAYADWLKQNLLPTMQVKLGISEEIAHDSRELTRLLRQHWQQAGGVAAKTVLSISHSGLAVLQWLLNAMLIPVITFYFLRDFDRLVRQLHDLLPRRIAPVVSRLATEADRVLAAFARGQFSVMLALSGVYSIGLWLVGLQFALLIGLLAGMLSFVPYLGIVLGLSLASLSAVVQFHNLWPLVGVLAVFTVGQLLEGMVLTPRLVGEKIGMHPVAVIFAVLAGGQLFGFLGVLLALPTAAVLMVLLRHAHAAYQRSGFYTTPHAEADDALEQSDEF